MDQTFTFLQRLALAFVAFFYALSDRRFAGAVETYRVHRRAHPEGSPPPALELDPAKAPPPAEPAPPAPGAKPAPTPAAKPAPPLPQPMKAAPPPPAPEPVKAAPQPKPPEPVKPPLPVRPEGEEALHLLTILQRDGRLVDFCSEELAGFSDADIGAAARTVHAGCKKAIDSYFKLEPIYRDADGAQVTVAPGFDAAQVRLTGNVVGSPPFTGALRHHGWRALSVKLPTHAAAGREIVAPAEVEL